MSGESSSSSSSSPSVDPTELEKEAVTLSLKAIYFDENNIPETAAFYYVEAAEAILNALKAGSKKEGLAQVKSECNFGNDLLAHHSAHGRTD